MTCTTARSGARRAAREPDRLGRYRLAIRLTDTHDRAPDGPISALDERLDRWVILRAVSAAPGPRRLDWLHRVAALHHPALAEVHDLVHDQGRLWLVREQVHGSSLDELLAAGRIDTAAAARVLHDVADALASAHDAGLAHGDLRASKVIVTPDGRARLVDLGLRAGPGSAEGALASRGDRTPEHDRAADVAALGRLGMLLLGAQADTAGGSLINSEGRQSQAAVAEMLEQMAELEASAAAPGAADLVELLEQCHGPILEPRLSALAPAPAQAPRARCPAGRSAARSAGSWPALSASVLQLTVLGLCALTAALLLEPRVFRQPRSPAPIWVALAPVAVEGAGTGVHPASLAATAEVAAVNTLVDLDGVQVVQRRGPRPSEPAAADPRLLRRALAADEVLLIRIHVSDRDCRVAVERIGATPATTRPLKWRSAPADGLLLLGEAVSQQVAGAFAGRHLGPAPGTAARTSAGTPDLGPRIRADDLEAFLEVRRAVLDRRPGTSWPDLLQRLEDLRRTSPGLVEASTLEASLARFLYQSSGDRAYLERAMDAIAAATRTAGDDPRILLATVDLALAADDLDRASEALDTIERRAPSHPGVASYRALLLERRGAADQAITLLEQAARERPSSRRLVTLADLEMRHGRLDSARRHLGVAHERDPGDVTTLERLARLELANGDPARAEALYLELMARAPQQRLVANLAAAQLLAGRPREALARLEAVTTGDEPGAAALVNLGDCLEVLGRTDEAARTYERALAALRERAARADHASTLALRAQCLAQLGRNAEAQTSAQQALALSPDSPDVVFAAALVATRAGHLDLARTLRRRALDLGLGPSWFSLPWFAGLDQPEHSPGYELKQETGRKGQGQEKGPGQRHSGVPRQDQ